MPAPDIIRRLVERFEEHRDSYRAGKYNEAQLRQEFLNPFFEALGWDLFNQQGYAEAYKEVIHEASLEVEGATKAPDYAFRIGGTRKFFVEAKKPAVNIQYDFYPAFQLRRYAWSAKLPLSVLTDFEEFAVYESRSKPDKSDSAATGRVMLLNYKDYLTRWDEIAAIFSRQAVLKGSFDQYAEGLKGKKGTTEVDDAFLEEIEHWRDLLARMIALRNPDLNVRELNYAVQMTIDRIVFLRICEDRGIEREDQLQELLAGEGVYERLCQLFRQADSRYNSGLFHFAEEKGQSSRPDDLTLRLRIDDRVLKEIIGGLYYPSPYVFREIPADILGQVYERFLGKVIRLTSGHQAKVEEKPEVRKAGGVYYTPTYIVDYIVKNTVGKLLENSPTSALRSAETADGGSTPPRLAPGPSPERRGEMTPKEAAGLKILDPACGSGSFLLGAYQYLLDWHTQWYCGHEPEKWAKGKTPAIYQDQGGDWRLTTAEKKKILLSNIHGVDIDPQAVEVTKLSLSLKVLEGESQESIGAQLGLFKERALPDLGRNIQCGNSLIGPDYYEGRQLTMFIDEDERYRVNAFNWQAAFPQVFLAGGFDAVIGNPPYVRSINLKESDPLLWGIYRSKYKAAESREWDIYLIFVEKGITLLNKNGLLGFILPNKFLNSLVGENLRSILSTGHWLRNIVHFGAYQVFEGVTTYTCLLFLGQNDIGSEINVARFIGDVSKSSKRCNMPEELPELWFTYKIEENKLSSSPWEFLASSSGLLNRIRKYPHLKDFAKVYKGTGTDADKVFALKAINKDAYSVQVYSKETEKEYILEPVYLRPVLKGRDIDRYSLSTKENTLLVVPYEIENGKVSLISEEELSSVAPKTLKYLIECKPRLNEREHGRFKGVGWYCYGRPQNMDKFEIPEKIVLPDIANRGACFLDTNQKWILDTVYSIVLLPEQKINIRFLLGILNSPILTYFLRETGTALRGGYFRMKTAYLNPFPIPSVNLTNPAEKTQHDRMVSLVDRMLELPRRSARTPQEQEMLRREIESTDGQIDRLVYSLYGLSEEEIKIVEGG
jgi:type I restriction-modification system DNA methylase subunit